MAEDLHLITGSKTEQYEELLPQIQAILQGEPSLIANLANTAAALHQQFRWWWIGFYLVANEAELVLGPFQGPIACTRIAKGKGVCGTAWQQQQTIVVKNVHEFPGHIACSSASLSEIVVPIFKNGEVVAVLDADSELTAHYDEVDAKYLEKLATMLSAYF